jgi:flagellin-specific chaperone FliS
MSSSAGRCAECEAMRERMEVPTVMCQHREALLRAGIEDAIQALTHLMKQRGKLDQGEIVSRVVQIVVPRLHAVLDGEDPYGD